MLSVKQIQHREEWEAFILKQPYTLFTQAPANGDFYESMGEQYWLFGLYEDDELVGGSLVTTVHAKRGDFLLLPYGPVLDFENQSHINTFFAFLKSFAHEKHYDFIRLSAFADDTPALRSHMKAVGARKAPIHILAENTWLLALDKNEDALLKDMKKNHRNLIKRCIREGVTVTQHTDEAALSRLNSMHDVVAARHKFARFSKSFIENEFRALSGKNNVIIFEAKLPDGQVDASAIIFFYGNMAAYRHSASLNTNKKLPTSYLIQWEVIKEARRRKKQWYNFWGIAPKNSGKKHPFAGITHFKTGFGGMQKDLLPAYDIPISSKYWFTWFIESIRRIKRGF